MTFNSECKHKHTIFYDFGESGISEICTDCGKEIQ